MGKLGTELIIINKGLNSMRKSELQNLCAGSKVMDKRNNTILEVVGLDKEQGKAIMDNGKVYSFSTIYRWFNLVEEQPVAVKEAPVQPIKPVEEKPVEPIKPTITEEKTVEDEIPGETHTNSNNHVVEGKNSIEEIFNQFNKVLDNHNCYFKHNKEYIGCMTDRKKGTLLQLKPNRQGSINIDVKRSIWEKLKEQYRHLLEQQYDAKLYDKSRGYIRIFNMEDVNTFTVLLLTALS